MPERCALVDSEQRLAMARDRVTCPERHITDLQSIHDWAAALDCAAATSKNTTERAALERASRALFQQPRGRIAKFEDVIRDRSLIQEAVWLVENDRAPTINGAFLLVAASVGGSASPRSVAERLRRRAKREGNGIHRNL
ncbi:MAG: hypothetical protein ABSD21_11195 [Rhizomicrobium sp.]|jgi:hypothetical protein